MPDTNDNVMDGEGGRGGLPGTMSGTTAGYDNALHHYRTVDSVVIPKEYFERMNSHDRAPRAVLRTVVGNPFPMPLMGFLIASTPLACALMGWRGAGGNGAAFVGVFYFFGGMLQIIGSVMEWIIGNTFPCVVFASYGAFWLALGARMTPYFNAEGAYFGTSAAADSAYTLALGKPAFYNTYAFFFMIMTVLSAFYTLASIRINITLIITFLFITSAFCMLMASYWTAAEGKMAIAGNLQIAAGAFVFTFCVSGWYLWCSLILEALDFPFILPLGDLSKRVPSGSSRQARKLEQTKEV